MSYENHIEVINGKRYIDIHFALSYGIQGEVEAIKNIKCREDQFQDFMEEKFCTEIDPFIEQQWDDFVEEQE